jgi:TRAP-type C4-dicarboxylate transport system permease small subunit
MGILKAAQSAEDKIEIVSRILGIIAIGVLVAMMLFTVLNVVLRAFFNRPIPGDVELIEISMVCTSFLGVAWCAMKEKHIRVDLLVSFLPKRAQGIIDSFCYLLALGATIIIAWQSIQEGFANREIDRLSASLGIPIFPFYWVTALGYGVLSLAILVLIVRSLIKAVNK